MQTFIYWWQGVTHVLNRPIRVLYIIGGGEFGGAEQHVLSLIRGLDPQRCEAEVACFYDALFAERVRESGVRVTLIGSRNVWTVYRTLKATIRAFQPDLIHTHGVRSNVVGRVMGKLLGIPVVTTIHSILALDYPNKVKRWLFQALESMTRPSVHTFIAVSQSIREALRKEGVQEDRIWVIYNGVDTDLFVPASERKQRMPSELPTVVTVARLHPVKGHRVLLEAIPLVQTPARYVFVGDGEMRPQLERIVRERNLPVTFVGHQDVILPFYQQADLVVQTSLSEGFSLSMAEALACGVPVVTTRTGGCLEIAQHVTKGVRLVDIGDVQGLAEAIDAMLSQSVEVDREAVVRHFSVRQMCANTLRLYTDIVAAV
jgi:glycosyltransferase involved in cell wall biosynthesis